VCQVGVSVSGGCVSPGPGRCHSQLQQVALPGAGTRLDGRQTPLGLFAVPALPHLRERERERERECVCKRGRERESVREGGRV